MATVGFTLNSGHQTGGANHQLVYKLMGQWDKIQG